MGKARPDDFDALIGNYYGRTPLAGDTKDPVTALLATYYGAPAPASRGRSRLPSVSLSLGCDDGEVLSQPTPSVARSTAAPDSAEATPLDFEEYVIDVPDAAPTESPQPAARTDPPPKPAPASRPSAAPPVAASAPPATAAATSESLSAPDADIASEIQSIIRQQKVYDQDRGMTDAPKAGSNDTESRTPPRPGATGLPSNGHEIFDRIAQSMQYANAYDLGTVELENRFAEFDRQQDSRRSAKQEPLSSPTALPTPAIEAPQPPAPTTGTTDTADFLADLDTIKSQSETPVLSRPFYDTGEHVIAGNKQYEGRLRVGKGQAVALSYGQVIAMGDLYKDVNDLFDADPAELKLLKALIEKNTAYYEGKRMIKFLDVDNDTWDEATKGRYLKLAEDNYEHFSPPSVAMGGVKTSHVGDNRTEWESYHRRAIQDAQREYLAHNGKVDIFFERALTINAFGDHFLTDAFAAGHLINKGVLIDRFKSAFYSGSSLNKAAEEFFERVAKTAWGMGDVAAKFSKLETVDWAHVSIKGHNVPLPFHPNIKDADRLGTLLKEAARQQPDRIGNLLVKALHDYLNANGIEVTNRAGDGTWILPGDGTLMVGTGGLTPADLAKNLAIMRKAVQQSIDDINSPSIRASNLNYQPFFEGVWRYVPQLTSASQSTVTALVRDYTDPNSATLVKAAAQIVKDQLDSFIKLLIKEHKLRPA